MTEQTLSQYIKTAALLNEDEAVADFKAALAAAREAEREKTHQFLVTFTFTDSDLDDVRGEMEAAGWNFPDRHPVNRFVVEAIQHFVYDDGGMEGTFRVHDSESEQQELNHRLDAMRRRLDEKNAEINRLEQKLAEVEGVRKASLNAVEYWRGIVQKVEAVLNGERDR